VTQTITSTQLPPGQTIERRRPGRTEYANPHLVALLRSSVRAAHKPGDRHAGAEDPNTLERDRDEAALLSSTVSLFDGACQVGSPDLILNQEPDSEGRRCSADKFLADQACYIADERIATANGIAVVKELTVDDVVLTPSGDRRVIGTRLFGLNPASRPRPELAAPIFIRRHTIAPGLPGRDLWASPTQCLIIGNHLVPARLLVNGTTVVQDLAQTTAQYYQLRFDRPACERLILSGNGLAPIQRRLEERAEFLGYDRALPGGTAELGLQLLVDGKPFSPVEICGPRQAFVVPPGHQVLQLAAQYDVAVAKIEKITQTDYDVIPADHPGLRVGWGRFQREGDVIWRCIIGLARVPTRPTKGGAMIVVHLDISENGA
jgi:Hint domain